MSYNGSGTFAINSTGQPVVAGTVISSTVFNSLTADLGTGLSTAITKDGQTTTTARILFAAGISSTLATDATSISTGSILTLGGLGVTKAAWIGGLMNVAGAATFQSTIGITGALTATTINASGLVAMAAAATVGTTLAVSGTATMATINASGTVAMAGAATVGTTLAVTGTSTMAAINASGTVAMAGAATVGTTLGVTGTSTMAAINASGTTTFTNASGGKAFGNLTSGINFIYSEHVNTSGDTIWGTEGSTAGTILTGSSAYAAVFASTVAKSLHLGTSNTVRLTIDSAGAVTIPGTSTLTGLVTAAGGVTVTGQNASSRNIDATGTATNPRIRAYDSTTGSAYLETWNNGGTNSLTMGLDNNAGAITGVANQVFAYSSGNFKIYPSSQTVLSFTVATTGLTFTDTGNTSALAYATFSSNGATAGSITRVAQTAVVTFNTSSDYRAKEVFGPLLNASDLLRKLKVYDGAFNHDVTRKPLMLAHEIQQVTPWVVRGEKDAVDENKNMILQTVAIGGQENLLVAGWQDLDTRLAAIEKQLKINSDKDHAPSLAEYQKQFAAKAAKDRVVMDKMDAARKDREAKEKAQREAAEEKAEAERKAKETAERKVKGEVDVQELQFSNPEMTRAT